MKRARITMYRENIVEDLSIVDDAISNGAVLNREEWFDFVFKMAFVGKLNKNIFKYYLFNKRLVWLAEAYADALHSVTTIINNGFTKTGYERMVSRVASNMNKLVYRKNPFTCIGCDRDGVNYIRVYADEERVGVFPVRSKKEAVKGIVVLTRYFSSIADGVPHDVEFVNFLDGFLSAELDRILFNERPTPYVCLNDSDRLASQLSRAGYNYYGDEKVIPIVRAVSW